MRGFITAESHTRDIRIPELIFMNDGQRPGVSRIIGVVIIIVEVVVDDDNRPIVPTQRAPANKIIIPPIPIHPGRAPNGVGDPVPAKPQPPMPSSVMVRAPSPRLIRYPIPAAEGIPDPSPIIVRPPIRISDIRNPDITVRSLIGPVTVRVELIFVFLELCRKIALGDILTLERIPVFVPISKIIAAGGQRPAGAEMPVGSHETLPLSDNLRSSLASGFSRPFDHHELSPAVFMDIHPVESFL